ncbi:hypothetical protein OG455_10205 [Kitasatospora sp. NBC_01287]|uniref:hypothetical protein n=1 Tax=Kitasatospora sp. NBC_01287 TaxID=2903573 RepID=UPI0022551203|nr:hypothetical protein [Kitasatospora sp. NBC_01287]MCX4745892.1 hypothetical protein [Kitasatospora sp. NBC_01287]
MLLRSNPSPGDDGGTRIEIYVGNVEVMFLKPRMKGVKIWRPSPKEASEAAEKFSIGDKLQSLYLVSSEDFCGFVVGGRPSWREAVRDFDDETLFDFGQEWPPGPEMNWGQIE